MNEFLKAMSALDEKTKAERALKDLQQVQGEEQVQFRVWLANAYVYLALFVKCSAAEYLLSFGSVC